MASIQFRLDSHSGLAPYRQLVAQVCDAVEAGRLKAGDRLPSVREVVTQVTINPNTVQRAYRELEHRGVAEGKAGLGTYITPSAPRAAAETTRESVVAELSDVIGRALSQGMQEEDVVDEVRRLFNLRDRVDV